MGRSTIDHTYLLDSVPEENTKVFAREYICQYGGPALNAAITFNLMGSGAKVVSCFGNSSSMVKVKEDLKSKYDIDVVDLIKDNKYLMPECSIYTISNSGTRTIVNPPKQDYKEEPYNEDINLEEASVILLDGFVFSDKLKNEIRKARERGTIVVLDGGSWKDVTNSILDIVDIAICSIRFKMPCHNADQTISHMLNKGVVFIAITDNEKEIDVIEMGNKTKIPVPAVDAIDTLGAGDVLHGAFCYYLAEGFNRKESLSRAALIASRSCCYFGTHTWKDFI